MQKVTPQFIHCCLGDRYPLHTAAQRGHADVLSRLIQAGPHQAVNQANFDSVTPLHEACQSGSVECVHMLLKAGASVSTLMIL